MPVGLWLCLQANAVLSQCYVFTDELFFLLLFLYIELYIGRGKRLYYSKVLVIGHCIKIARGWDTIVP